MHEVGAARQVAKLVVTATRSGNRSDRKSTARHTTLDEQLHQHVVHALANVEVAIAVGIIENQVADSDWILEAKVHREVDCSVQGIIARIVHTGLAVL